MIAYLYTVNAHSLIATLLVVGLIIWLLFYVLPLPAQARTILAVVVAVLLILWLIPGCSTGALAAYNATVASRSDALKVDASKDGYGGGYVHTVTYR